MVAGIFLTFSFEHVFPSYKNNMRIEHVEWRIQEVINDESNKTCAEEPLKYLNFYSKPIYFKLQKLSSVFKSSYQFILLKAGFFQFNFLLSPFLKTLCQIRPRNLAPNTLLYTFGFYVTPSKKFSHFQIFFGLSKNWNISKFYRQSTEIKWESTGLKVRVRTLEQHWLKVQLSHSKKKKIICFNDSPSKMIRSQDI